MGAGITGLSAAWLLSQGGHKVTLFEKDARLGGHANSVALPGRALCVDTGFIVYNEANYPNFTALMAELGVATQEADMSFAASLQGGRVEYASNDLAAFLGGGRNLLSPRFWSMALDIVRFYKTAKADVDRGGETRTLGAYLDARGYGEAFQCDHILPMAAAIWSSSPICAYPLEAFVRFFNRPAAGQPASAAHDCRAKGVAWRLDRRLNAESPPPAPSAVRLPAAEAAVNMEARGCLTLVLIATRGPGARGRAG